MWHLFLFVFKNHRQNLTVAFKFKFIMFRCYSAFDYLQQATEKTGSLRKWKENMKIHKQQML